MRGETKSAGSQSSTTQRNGFQLTVLLREDTTMILRIGL